MSQSNSVGKNFESLAGAGIWYFSWVSRPLVVSLKVGGGIRRYRNEGESCSKG